MSYRITGEFEIDEMVFEEITMKNIRAKKCMVKTKKTVKVETHELNGKTEAMVHIIEKKTIPDKSLMHEPFIRDGNGFTMAMHWIKCVAPSIKFIPGCLIHDINLQDNNGKTMAMTWAKYVKTMPPNNIMHSDEIKDVHDKTLKNYIDRYVYRTKNND